ncbi:hypothetical protein [Actinomyces sp.]|uniref:hypothetical protein n=1 Tax=Actinomyces sp. TaxID=29317 RepID=UPI0026DA8CA6|nr:hypothetical protein [Actinomyces sp.]MDO4901220.1 hypothetical protein [Actinomyces sp.]
MSNSVLAAQVRARLWLDDLKTRVSDSEAGQGAAEYAGVIVIAAILIVAIATAINNAQVGTTVTNKIQEILNPTGGGAGAGGGAGS